MVERNADALHHHRFHGQLSALSWPDHFFPKASFRRSFCMLTSAYMRFSRRFYSAIALAIVLGPMADKARSR